MDGWNWKTTQVLQRGNGSRGGEQTARKGGGQWINPPFNYELLSQLFEEILGQLELSSIKKAGVAKTRPASTPDRMLYTDLLKNENKSTLY